jgi:hypothetical protein
MSISFKESLNERVFEVRRNVKRDIIDALIEFLKNKMSEAAENGLRSGSIMCSEIVTKISENTELHLLEKILIEEAREDKSDTSLKQLDWLLIEVSKWKMYFGGVEMVFVTRENNTTYLDFSWGDDE